MAGTASINRSWRKVSALPSSSRGREEEEGAAGSREEEEGVGSSAVRSQATAAFLLSVLSGIFFASGWRRCSNLSSDRLISFFNPSQFNDTNDCLIGQQLACYRPTMSSYSYKNKACD